MKHLTEFSSLLQAMTTSYRGYIYTPESIKTFRVVIHIESTSRNSYSQLDGVRGNQSLVYPHGIG